MLPKLIDINKFTDTRGTLGVIDQNVLDDLGFVLRRCFYITDVEDGGLRGAHAHLECTQIILCTSGSLKVDVNTPINDYSFQLDKVNSALVIPPMHWGIQYGFEANTSYVVLADREYNEGQYLRNLDTYNNIWTSRNEG